MNDATRPGAVTAPVAGGRSKTVAGILGLILGIYGAHNFYLGYYVKAIVQLLAGAGGTIVFSIYTLAFYYNELRGDLSGLIRYEGESATVSSLDYLIIFTPVFIISLLLATAVSIWTTVEAILILTARPGSSWSFDAKKNPLT